MNADRVAEDSSLLPLILIKGLRGGTPDAKVTLDASDFYCSSNTSEKDDSGGDDTEGSNNLFSISKNLTVMPTPIIGTSGPVSSLSGSEEGNNFNANGAREGILRNSGNSAMKSDSMSISSAKDNGGDELSECVVVRGKSVAGGPPQEQPQIKVSFAMRNHSAVDGNASAVLAPVSSKRKRCEGSKSDDMDIGEKIERKKMYLDIDPTSSNSFPGSQSARLGKPPPCNPATVSYTSSTTAYTPGKAPLKASSFQVSSTHGGDEREPGVGSPSQPSCNAVQKKHPQHVAKSLLGSNNEERRLERNQREKERSNRISCQVDALRSLLQRGGLFIPKNTKSTVLSEATAYIRTLQERQQLMNLEMEGLKRQLVDAMAVKQPAPSTINAGASSIDQVNKQCDNNSQDYQLIFKNTIAGMAVASMGGALLDCNAAFHSNTGIAASDLRGKTIFDIVHPTDLPRALDLISRMIDDGFVGSNYDGNASAESVRDPSPSARIGINNSQDNDAVPPSSLGGPSEFNGSPMVVLKSSFPQRPDLGLCVSLIRGEDMQAKCFNITLAKNISPPGLSSSRGFAEPLNQAPFNPSLPNYPNLDPQTPKTGTLPSQSLNDTNCNPPQNQTSINTPVEEQQDLSGEMINTMDNGAMPPGIPPQLVQLLLLSQQQEQLRERVQLHGMSDNQQQLLQQHLSPHISHNEAPHIATGSSLSTLQASCPQALGVSVNPAISAPQDLFVGEIPVAQRNANQQGGTVQIQQFGVTSGGNFPMLSAGPPRGENWNFAQQGNENQR